MRSSRGELLTQEAEVEGRWRGYFEQLLKEEEKRCIKGENSMEIKE